MTDNYDPDWCMDCERRLKRGTGIAINGLVLCRECALFRFGKRCSGCGHVELADDLSDGECYECANAAVVA